ncbi:hypothetical protein [Sporosarcina limicola]|uniref:Energy-converting hydrogenase Eha subunit C n=1 Tax=Sporosarcina limicola TaxID=34101 RepID=A0A927MKS0_9BACL|nr:hypothetical protein [Sporosarcina limicola]MBE1553359.1 energy-converting hydrogenase Eha subunit C [Sporosarcina limicola]
MIRIVMMALVSGVVLGITAGSYYGGLDVEGIVMGLTSIVCIVAISSFMIFYEKKRMAKFEV